MLTFLRKYQKYFFVVITVVIVLSFSFFGTFSTMQNRQKQQKSRVIGATVTGRPVKNSEFHTLVALLSAEGEGSLQRGSGFFLEGGVMERDLFPATMDSLIAQANWDKIQPEIELRLEKIKHCSFYVHPQAPFISSREIWKQFCPQALALIQKIQSQEKATLETFHLLSQLYQEQKKLPPQLLRRVLVYQQQQVAWIKPDPELFSIDLSLCGFHSLSDWFGRVFVERVGYFIIQSAAIAEQKGYRVSDKEVWFDLSEHIRKSGVKGMPLGAKVGTEGCSVFLRSLGLNNDRAVDAWRNVLLLQKYFGGIDRGVLVDPIPYQEFASYAKEEVILDLYRLPESLALKNFHDLMKLEFYLQAVSSFENRGELGFPKEYYDATFVAKNYPEMVENRYFLEVSSLNGDKLELGIGERELWDWQLDENHWKDLQKEFSLLNSMEGTREERFRFLESLSPSVHAQVDSFSRKQIVMAHPEWIEKELAQAPKEKKWFAIRPKGGSFPFKGIEDRKAFIDLLEKVPLVEEGHPSPESPLLFFTQDGIHTYRIQIFARESAPSIVPFAEVAQDGTLDSLLRGYLEEEYPIVRLEETKTFQGTEGTWKPFEEVQEEVGRLVFSSLLKAIEKDYRKIQGKLPSAEKRQPLEFYSSHRLYFFMREVYGNLLSDAKRSSVVREKPQELADKKTLVDKVSLADQWKLEYSQKTLLRTSARTDWEKEAFSLPVLQWGSPQKEALGTWLCFQVLEKKAPSKDCEKEVDHAKKLLLDEMHHSLAEQLLKQIEEQGSFFQIAEEG